jgi:hypothetical protein
MALFRLLPQLRELVVTIDSVMGVIGEEDLVSFFDQASVLMWSLIPSFKMKLLLCLSNSTSIMRLRMSGSGDPLPEHLLCNIGAAPASLKYITWDIWSTVGYKSYRLESQDGKTIAIPAELPYPWTTILVFDDFRVFTTTVPESQ